MTDDKSMNMAARTNRDWWPNQLSLNILHQNSNLANPMEEEFDYAKEFKSLDLDAVINAGPWDLHAPMSVAITIPVSLLVGLLMALDGVVSGSTIALALTRGWSATAWLAEDLGCSTASRRGGWSPTASRTSPRRVAGGQANGGFRS